MFRAQRNRIENITNDCPQKNLLCNSYKITNQSTDNSRQHKTNRLNKILQYSNFSLPKSPQWIGKISAR